MFKIRSPGGNEALSGLHLTESCRYLPKRPYVACYVTACVALECLQWSVRARVSSVPTEHRSAPPNASSSHLRPPSRRTPRPPPPPPPPPPRPLGVARRPRAVTCVARPQSQSGRVVRHPLRNTRSINIMTVT